MKVEQLYTGCLAQGAYYIESNGEAAVIDPLRETSPYLKLTARDKSKIKYVFETHFHADFVSGHITLSKKTGASIVFGPEANPSYKAIIAKDKQVFELGKIQIIALHTPGHTIESTTYLLRDEKGNDHAIFTGDTLFLGDVGIPDVAQLYKGITKEALASILYDSINNKIKPLDDNIIVYPGHGAGSACGKNMMKETVDTLGNQKKINYALSNDVSKKSFVKDLTDGLPMPPKYFPLNVKMNKEGYMDLDVVIKRGLNALSADAFEITANETSAIVLDVRHQSDFIKGHIPSSIFIGLDGRFAPWVGTLIAKIEQPILLIADPARVEEAITRLSRVGFDNTIGYLENGFSSWVNANKEIDTLTSISANELKSKLTEKNTLIFDVRKTSEFESERIPSAKSTPLSFLNDPYAEFPTKKPFYLHCAGGYRSVIAASLLKNRGIHNIIDVEGGLKAIKNAGISVSNYVKSA